MLMHINIIKILYYKALIYCSKLSTELSSENIKLVIDDLSVKWSNHKNKQSR